ncbi:MAG TPA: hypothetical protein VGH40_15700 [Roseiarcus sp.]|jgi:hypothetical protein
MRISTSSPAAISAILAIVFASAPATAKTRAECQREYADNRDAIKASGQTKKAYIASCRAGQSPGAAPMAQPMAEPSPTPSSRGY